MSLSRRRFIEATAATSAFLVSPALGSISVDSVGSQHSEIDHNGFSGSFDSFSERARRVMQFANQQAQRLNHDYVGTEHLLLALFAEAEEFEATGGANWLMDLGVMHEDIDCVTHFVVGRGEPMVLCGKLPYTHNMTSCLDNAVDSACDLGDRYVEAEHLLLGIVDSFGTTANMLLQEMWMERGAVRQVAYDSLRGK